MKSSVIIKLSKAKLKGGALYVAIMVGIVIGLMLSMFILLAQHNQRTVTLFTQNSQLNFNLKSALEIAKSDQFTEHWNNKWFKNYYGNDSIRVKKINWGAYLLIVAQTKNRHHSISQSGLYGTLMSSDSGLVTADNSRPVGMSGNVVLKANCYLPAGGIKPAFIEGQSYIGNAQNAGFTKTAPFQIAEITDGFKDGILKQQNELNVLNDSLVSALPNFITQSFDQKTLVWETAVTRLNSLKLTNNIKIISHSGLIIDSTCHLENILIICKKIRFKEGFKGSVHVIASDSIIAEKKSEFMYPSSFVLSADNNENSLNYIEFLEETKFSGGLIAFSNSNNKVNKVFIKLNATGEVNGLVYSENYLHLEGKVNANVFCNSLLLKTPSAVYENHMLGCEIDPGKYAHILAIPMLMNKNCKLLNSKLL